MNQPPLPTHYPVLLADIKQRIGQARTWAVRAVNAELIRLYWGSTFELTRALPSELASSLPSIGQIERELGRHG